MTLNCDRCGSPQERVHNYPIVTCFDCKRTKKVDTKLTKFRVRHYGKITKLFEK
jgi:hypothetical protein